MVRNTLAVSSTLAACLASGTGIWLIGSLDREGSISISRPASDPAAVAVLLAPLLIIAALAVWSRGRRFSTLACLLAATVAGAWSVGILWVDYLARSREPRGRETMHMGMVGALVVLWAACFVVMILVGAEWGFGNRGRNRADPVDGPASDGRAPQSPGKSP